MTNSGATEYMLVEQAKMGDHLALLTLMQEHRYIVDSVLLPYPSDIREDVLQDLWIRVLLYLPSLREPNAFKRWLIIITRRLAIDYSKIYKTYETLDSAESLPDLDEASVKIEEEQQTRILILKVQDVLHGLPKSDADLLQAFYASSRSVGSVIAKQLGVSSNTLYVRLHRARTRFQREFEKRAS